MAEPTIKAKLILDTSTGGVGGMADTANSLGGGGSKSGIKVKGMKSLLKVVGRVVALAQIIGVALGSTLKMLGNITKMLGLILKPIGDMLTIALLPILFLLKPIAKIMNVLFRPFLRASLVAMKTGSALASQGDAAGAAEAFGLGVATLLKPIFDILMLNLSSLAQVALSLVQVALTPLFSVIAQIMELFTGVPAEQIFAAFQDGFNQARESVGVFFASIMEFTNELLFGRIAELANDAGMEVSSFTEGVTMSFTTLALNSTELMDNIVTTVTTKLGVITGLNEEMIDAFREDLEDLRKKQVDPMTESISGEDGLNVAMGGANSLVLELTESINGLKNAASSMMDSLSKWVSRAKNAAKSVGKRVLKLGVGFAIGGPTGMTIANSIRDGIVTKEGKVIKIDSQDDIFASKNGFKGMGGGSVNVSVSVNAIDSSSISDAFVRKLTSQITENMKRELQGRSSYGVGI